MLSSDIRICDEIYQDMFVIGLITSDTNMCRYGKANYLKHAKVLDVTEMSKRDWMGHLCKFSLGGTVIAVGGACIYS